MDLGTIINRAQRLAGRVDPNFDSRTIQFVNEGVEEWARKRPWLGLRRTETHWTTGERRQAMPPYMFQVLSLGDVAKAVSIIAKEDWDREDPSRYFSDTAGNPYYWREVATWPVSWQPAETEPARVWVQCSNPSSVNLHLAGFALDTNRSGTADALYEIEEILAVAGPSPYTSVNEYVFLSSAGKDEITELPMAVHFGATSNSRIPATRYRSNYRVVEFETIPAAGVELRVEYLQYPNALTRVEQQPHPSITPEFLIWYAAAQIHLAMGEDQAASLKAGKATEILNARALQEGSFADRESQLRPDFRYWNFQDNLDF